MHKKDVTPFKSTEARVVGGRKVVERRGLHWNRKNLNLASKKLQESNTSILLLPNYRCHHPPIAQEQNLFWLCSIFSIAPKRHLYTKPSLIDKNSQFFQFFCTSLNINFVELITNSSTILVSIDSPDFLSKKKVWETRHMWSHPVLLGGDKHQPQHPVHPFQLRHLGYFSPPMIKWGPGGPLWERQSCLQSSFRHRAASSWTLGSHLPDRRKLP